MNTQSNAMPESFDSQRINPAAMTETRPMYWSVRRELWENRYIYIAPLAVAAVTLFGHAIATMFRVVASIDHAQAHAAMENHYAFATGAIMATAFVAGIFYSLDALHGERRDRSILFWKSLPVSDLTTVLSKASIPLVVVPLLSFGIVVATETIMRLLSTMVFLASGLSTAAQWTQPSMVLMWLLLLYHLVMVHVLWHAPIYGWLMLVSGWARRAAILWAALPPLAIIVVEKIVFGTSHFAALLRYRFVGGPEAVFAPGSMPIDPMTHLTPGRFLVSPGLWIGLLVAAAFFFAAARLRRSQGPI